MEARDPGEWTRESCWLCNRGTGELCHVHDQEFVRMRAGRDEEADGLGGVVLEARGRQDGDN